MSLVSSRLFLLEPVDLLGDVDRRLVLHVAQLFDLGLEIGDRLLEVEEVSLAHGLSVAAQYATRQRVEAAPNVPSRDRAERRPGVADLAGLGARTGSPLK